MRKQQPTPVEPGTNSTDADAVKVAGKPTKSKFQRGKDVTFKVNSKLTTNIIALGHAAFLASRRALPPHPAGDRHDRLAEYGVEP